MSSARLRLRVAWKFAFVFAKHLSMRTGSGTYWLINVYNSIMYLISGYNMTNGAYTLIAN